MAHRQSVVRRLILPALSLVLALTGTAMAVEEAPYAVSLEEGAIEVRDYPPLIAAEVTVPGDQDAAANAGFRLLAGYIFGANQRRQRIAMTAPVVQAPAGAEKIAMTAPVVQTPAGAGWTVRFLMPKGLTLDTLPTPNDARVTLLPLPAARFAVIRFSGLAYPGDVAARTADLQAFIAAHQLKPLGTPSLARFNPPWTLWFLRRNEVMIAVQ